MLKPGGRFLVSVWGRLDPIYLAIMERRPAALADIKAAVARNLSATLGDHPLRCPLRTIFFSAHRPAA